MLNFPFTSIYLISICFLVCVSEKVVFINVEHPRVTYFNPQYLNYANLTAMRYGRNNPVYYVGLHFDTLIPFDHKVHVDIYFYELLTNVFKRSFVEFHFNWCHLVEKDMFFGSAMRQGKLLKPCPHLPGDYHLYNMTINPAFIPRGFPFTKGRIQANFTVGKAKMWVADGYVDMRISEVDKKRKINFSG